MKTRLAVLAAAALLLASSLALAQGGIDPPGPFTVAPSVISGGSFQLSSLAWEVGGAASGGGYRLVSGQRPALTGSGCCCFYIPCVKKNAP